MRGSNEAATGRSRSEKRRMRNNNKSWEETQRLLKHMGCRDLNLHQKILLSYNKTEKTAASIFFLKLFVQQKNCSHFTLVNVELNTEKRTQFPAGWRFCSVLLSSFASLTGSEGCFELLPPRKLRCYGTWNAKWFHGK